MKLLKVAVVALVLSVPALVLAETPATTPTKAPEAAKVETAKAAETTAAKVVGAPEARTFEGTISYVNTAKNTFTLKDTAGTTYDIAYNMTGTLKTGEKVKVNCKKEGINWTATNLERVK